MNIDFHIVIMIKICFEINPCLFSPIRAIINTLNTAIINIICKTL